MKSFCQSCCFMIITQLVGLNKIAAAFNPEYEQYTNLNGYDLIARYFLREEHSDDDDEWVIFMQWFLTLLKMIIKFLKNYYIYKHVHLTD